jgi:hypothetical protein
MVLLALLPIILTTSATWIAERAQCVLNEAGSNPCIIMGADWGGVLYTLFVMGWFMLISWLFFPVGGLLFMVMYILWAKRTDKSIDAIRAENGIRFFPVMMVTTPLLLLALMISGLFWLLS